MIYMVLKLFVCIHQQQRYGKLGLSLDDFKTDDDDKGGKSSGPLLPVKADPNPLYKRHYYEVVIRNKELRQMTELLLHRVKAVMNLANKHKQTFMEHSYLWTESRRVDSIIYFEFF